MGRGPTEASVQQEGHRSAPGTAPLERTPRAAVNSPRLVFLCSCSPGSHAPQLAPSAVGAREAKQPVPWSPLLPLVQTHGRPGETVCEGRGRSAYSPRPPAPVTGLGLPEAAGSPLGPRVPPAPPRPCKDGAGGKHGQ